MPLGSVAAFVDFVPFISIISLMWGSVSVGDDVRAALEGKCARLCDIFAGMTYDQIELERD